MPSTRAGSSPTCSRSSSKRERLEALIVPKAETAGHVREAVRLIERIEQEKGGRLDVGLELVIESPLGVVNLREIVQASDRIRAVIFGPGDFASSMRIPQLEIGSSNPEYPGHQWHWVMCEIAVHARAAGVLAIDGPFADFRDEPGFRESARRGRLLGYDGKWCIHPEQIPWANDVFSPGPAEIEAAKKIVDAYTVALEQGGGAIAVNGNLVDEATRKGAETTLARAESIGL